MAWLGFMALAATTWMLHTVCIKFIGDRLPTAFVTFGFYIFALLTSLVLLMFNRTKIDMSVFSGDWKVAAALAGAGVTIGLTDFFFIRGLNYGAPLSIYAPAFSTLALALIALAGVVVFSESLTVIKLAGFACAAVGIFLMVK